MIIRRAELNDSGGVLSLRNSQDAVFWSRTGIVTADEHAIWFVAALKNPRHRILVMVNDEGNLIGYARYYRRGHRASVSVAVDPHESGKGYGLQLLMALEQDAVVEGVTQLTASIHPSNSASYNLFRRGGYQCSRPMKFETLYKEL